MVLMEAVLPLAHLQIKVAPDRAPPQESSAKPQESCTPVAEAAQMATREVVFAAPVPVVKVEAETERCMVTETLTLPAALTILAEVEEVQRPAR